MIHTDDQIDRERDRQKDGHCEGNRAF